jgi:DNA invertase Pin-like site-specific DNA recombinase
LAIVYVRQSSLQQVLENRESTLRQYALADCARAMGWPAERVLVIDEDQGLSGRSANARAGFQRLLAEVGMDHAGLILGLEMSRLARSDKDWHHLLELCGVFGTLLADQDGIYDAADPNDRLLLGLKGTMSSLELQTMRNRLEKGRLSKAQRGELFCSVPVGYVRLPGGGVALDPDEQARATVQLLFQKFEELGTLHALMLYLYRNKVLLPSRARGGPRAGELQWHRPGSSNLASIFHHPIYAGAYSYGRRPSEARRSFTGGKKQSRARLPMHQWKVLIPGRLPAYISWEQYLKNVQRLRENRTTRQTRGTPRAGSALLSGLVICGRCGWRMQTGYNRQRKAYYTCRRHWAEQHQSCQCYAAAACLDEIVSRQLLRALEPAGLELSLKAQEDVDKERQRLEKHWQQSLQRAEYDAAAAERRYRAVDAQNRLVAATLERQWEEALRRQRGVQEEYDRFSRQPLSQLSAEQKCRIAALAADIPALWRAPGTTPQDRKAVLRCLIERVEVRTEPDSEQAEASIHWAGGHVTDARFVRPVRSYARLSGWERLQKRVIELREAGRSAVAISAILNEEGFAPIQPGGRITAEVVRRIFRKLGVQGEIEDDSLLERHEWWIRDLADELRIPWGTLRGWAVRGWVNARQTRVQRIWILWADAEDLKRLSKLRRSVSGGVLMGPEELIRPKKRPSRK